MIFIEFRTHEGIVVCVNVDDISSLTENGRRTVIRLRAKDQAIYADVPYAEFTAPLRIKAQIVRLML
jgi:hypothetical protein